MKKEFFTPLEDLSLLEGMTLGLPCQNISSPYKGRYLIFKEAVIYNGQVRLMNSKPLYSSVPYDCDISRVSADMLRPSCLLESNGQLSKTIPVYKDDENGVPTCALLRIAFSYCLVNKELDQEWSPQGPQPFYGDILCPTQLLTAEMTPFVDARQEDYANADKYCPLPTGILNEEQVDSILSRLYPYTYRWAKTCDFVSLRPLLIAPCLENLYKSGYQFAKSFLTFSRYGNRYKSYTLWRQFFKLCNPYGTNLASIFKVDAGFYQPIREEPEMAKIDTLRVMYGRGKITKEDLTVLVEYGYDKDDLTKIKDILNSQNGDKNIFTLESLLNYLQRLDMFQGLEVKEALPMLRDCLAMWRRLGMEPVLDSDSIEREHRILIRRSNQERKIREDSEIQEASKHNSLYNYEDETFLIRTIESADDLLAEAQMQHNCVACYAPRIASGSSLIFTLRYKEKPEQSYVTVETDEQLHIRQKLRICNMPIYDKPTTDFLSRWERWATAKKKELIK